MDPDLDPDPAIFVKKKSQNSRNQGCFIFFCLMTYGSDGSGSATLVPRLQPTYLSEMSVVYVGYDVEKQPVDLLDDLIEVWWEVVAVL
jgi:hypothetical protein